MSLLSSLFSGNKQNTANAQLMSLERRAISDPEAAFDLALYYRQQLGDTRMAFKWYLHAAEKGQSDAMLMVGASYLEGVGVEKSKDLGKKWIYKAEKAGNPNAVKVRVIHGLPSEEIDKLASEMLTSEEYGQVQAKHKFV